MEYKDFLTEYDAFSDWDYELTQGQNLVSRKHLGFGTVQGGGDHLITYLGSDTPAPEDRVNSPKHYTAGRAEVIDVIEDAISGSVDSKSGFLQGQVIKYILRLWLKDNPLEDAKKSKWYLERLIAHLDSEINNV